MSVQLANGYSFVSTFGDDFAIANHFGKDAIRDTFNRAFEEWKTNHAYPYALSNESIHEKKLALTTRTPQ